jgi:hypothetical protein
LPPPQAIFARHLTPPRTHPTPPSAPSPRAAPLQIIIADRSPLSAVFYARTDGHMLEPLIRQYVTELKAAADVHIYMVHLRTDRELLWQRIQDRLRREPHRQVSEHARFFRCGSFCVVMCSRAAM